MKRRKRIVLWILLCMLICSFGALQVWKGIRQNRILDAVHLENAEMKRVDYTYWCDPLQYTDGYEIMVFSPKETPWTPPVDWERLDGRKNVDDLASELDIHVNEDAIYNLSLGGYDCTSYILVDNRGKQLFDEQDFFFSFCYETNTEPLIFVYRGHHLYGI